MMDFKRISSEKARQLLAGSDRQLRANARNLALTLLEEIELRRDLHATLSKFEVQCDTLNLRLEARRDAHRRLGRACRAAAREVLRAFSTYEFEVRDG